MKVLVTGAAGQVGSRLVRQLLERGYKVKALILPSDPMQTRIEGLDIEVVEGNLLDPNLSPKLVADVDAVIHTANLVSPLPGMSESEFFDNNVRGTFHLIRASSKRANTLERFVYISSSSVYPNDAHIIAPCYNPVDEFHPLRPIGIYASSKMACEIIVAASTRESGLKTSIIRPSGICSGDAILRRWTVSFVCNLLKIGQAHPQGTLYMSDGTELWRELERKADSPDQLCAISDMEGRPWLQQPVDARDVAHACICALEHCDAIGEVFNIAAPQPIPFTQATRIISKATGQSVLEWRVPVRWIFDLDIAKAKSRIDYRPRWGIEEMVHSALAVQRGETDGMT